jgi:hypothetical protein
MHEFPSESKIISEDLLVVRAGPYIFWVNKEDNHQICCREFQKIPYRLINVGQGQAFT